MTYLEVSKQRNDSKTIYLLVIQTIRPSIEHKETNREVPPSVNVPHRLGTEVPRRGGTGRGVLRVVGRPKTREEWKSGSTKDLKR